MALVLLAAGLVLLILGAEALVRGSSRLAAAVGVPPLIVGLTVVAFGTSAPELAVSVGSAFSGRADIAVGNVVGSNIFNVLFILGLSALITPLAVSQRLVRLDVPFMIAVSLLLLLLGLDGRIGRGDGALLFLGLVGYTSFLALQGRREESAGTRSPASVRRWPLDALLALVGLGLLIVGSGWFVDGAVTIARRLGLSELIIGLTIVAAGTSLPEVATSVVASLRGERDIAVGNVVGSNLFNILGVLGLSGVVAPLGIAVAPAALRFDLPVMIAVAVACLPIFFTGGRIARWEGGLFLGAYLAYTLYLVLAATQTEAVPLLRNALLYFVLPLVGLTLAVVGRWAIRSVRTGRARRRGP